ncbi:hypothetical protein WA171_004100, partial [Blastocystis sp. BT1]
MATVYPKIYRFSNLGTSLIQSLDSLVEEGKLTGQQREAVLKQYDKEMYCEMERRKNKLPKAKLTGDLLSYKRLYDTWTFLLNNWLLCIDDEQNLMDVQAKFFSMIAVKM